MKSRLLTVFNAMKNIETKGENTLIMADCMRELVSIINSMPDESEAEDGRPDKA